MKDKLHSVLNQMNDINYGFVCGNEIYIDSTDDFFSNNYYLLSPTEVLKYKCGVCFDQVELERYYFEHDNIKHKSYIIASDMLKDFTHTFMVIHDDKYYWFEHSWEKYRGIHEYDNLELLLDDIENKFKKSLNNISNDTYIYEYSKPKFGINELQFYEHCKNGILIRKS